MKDDLTALPAELRRQSLSDREIVLPYAEALLAIDALKKSGYAVVVWEGWVLYPDGRVGHASHEAQGTADHEWMGQWNAAEEFVRRTMERAQVYWSNSGRAGTLHFCLSTEPMAPRH